VALLTGKHGVKENGRMFERIFEIDRLVERDAWRTDHHAVIPVVRLTHRACSRRDLWS
jgi:hypothetical protein